MTDDQYKECTAQIKALADVRKLSIEDPDLVINNYYDNIMAGNGSNKPLLNGMTAKEQKFVEQKAADLTKEVSNQ